MAFRIACDLDGVLADMGAALTREERRLMGIHDLVLRPLTLGERENGIDHDDKTSNPVVAEMQKHGLSAVQQRLLWRNVAEIPNFWESLPEIEPGTVKSLAALRRKLRWEVIFLTKRPRTAGDIVQIQTQRWLTRQGFEHPSVFVVNGSRGKVADALALDFVIDDLPAHCVDVVSDSKAKPILVWRDASATVPATAKRLGIQVARSMAQCLELLVTFEGRAQRRTWRERFKSALRPAALT